MDILIEIIAQILRDNKFAASVLGHNTVGAQYIDAYIPDQSLTKRVSVWGDSKSFSCTQMTIEMVLTYPKIDQGEDNILAHDFASIEFASPDSIEQFIAFINKKLEPKPNPWLNG